MGETLFEPEGLRFRGERCYISEALEIEIGNVAAPTPEAASATPTPWSHSISGSLVNRALLVATASNRAGSHAVSGVTAGGAAMTQIGAVMQVVGSYYFLATLWGLVAPAAGVLTIAPTLNASAYCVCASLDLGNVDQANPFSAAMTAAAASGATGSTINITATRYDLLVDVIAKGVPAEGFNAMVYQTELMDAQDGRPGHRGSAAWKWSRDGNGMTRAWASAAGFAHLAAVVNGG